MTTQNHVDTGTPGIEAPAETVEQEIQRKGLTAPRVTPQDIEGDIAHEYYFTAGEAIHHGNLAKSRPVEVLPESLGLLTICVLVLRNGFVVTGESACASPENFDAELGRKIARRNAEAKIWPLLGYELRTFLANPAVDEFVLSEESGPAADAPTCGTPDAPLSPPTAPESASA